MISREIHELYDSSHLEVKFGICPVEDAYMPVESACGMAQLACDRIRDIPDRHISFYTKAMGEARRLRSYVIDHFQKAMDNRWIQVYFQPVIRSISGTMASVEALARWVDPKRAQFPRDFHSLSGRKPADPETGSVRAGRNLPDVPGPEGNGKNGDSHFL